MLDKTELHMVVLPLKKEVTGNGPNLSEKYVESGKVKYLGHLDLLQYARLLKSSDVHVYLTSHL